MNLAIRGISHNLGEKNDSTFTNDLHKDRKFDYIMANPPFNLKGWRGEDELTMIRVGMATQFPALPMPTMPGFFT